MEAVSITAAFRGYGAVLRDRHMLAFCLIALLPLYAFGQIWATMPVMLATCRTSRRRGGASR